MSKLKRDIASWSKRVMMSKTRVWAVVEGKSVDAPFVEGVLGQAVELDGVEIIKAEDIEIDGVAAGGKGHALRAFRYFQDAEVLSQSNRSGAVDWLFFVDKDDDDFLNVMIDSPHVIYTHNADVEAEVLANVDLDAAVATAYSLPTSVVRSASLGRPIDALAELWEEWILLRLAACACGVGTARFAQHSQVHAAGFGEYDSTRSQLIHSDASAAVGEQTWTENVTAARDYLRARRTSDELGRSVKGKWVPLYVGYLIRQRLGDDHKLPNVNPAHLLSVGVAKLDFNGPWAEEYRERLRSLIAA